MPSRTVVFCIPVSDREGQHHIVERHTRAARGEIAAVVNYWLDGSLLDSLINEHSFIDRLTGALYTATEPEAG